MKQTIRHDATPEQARQAIDTAAQVYCRKFPQYQPHSNWVNDQCMQVSFTVKGMKLDADIQLKSDRIEMEMDVPFLFLPIRGQAMKMIESEIRKWLSRAKAGEIRA